MGFKQSHHLRLALNTNANLNCDQITTESTYGTRRVSCSQKGVKHTVSNGGGSICIKSNNSKSHCNIWHFVHVDVNGAQVFSSRCIPGWSSDSDTVLCPGYLATHLLKNFSKFYITLCKTHETSKILIIRSLLGINNTGI